VYVTGSLSSPVGRNVIGTLAYDAIAGDRLWTAAEGPEWGYSSGAAVGVSPDSTSVYVTGSLMVKTDGRTDYVTIAYPG
jgi:hypothetical protein